MKHIFTISLCFLALSLSAQEPDGLCCDPDGTNYDFITCFTSGWSELYDNDGCVEDPDCTNYNPYAQCLPCFPDLNGPCPECEGQFDECGICNGPGAIYECGCSDMPAGDCDCFGNELDACGECGGDSGCLFCGEGTSWDPVAHTCVIDDSLCAWQPDGNADGLIGVEDLLDLLAVYGDTDIDSDGIWDSIDDCIDLTACNYANDPTEACNYIDVLGNCGGGCEGDGDDDGICDSEDDCIGVIDECGVCNGPGPTEIVIESITILYDSLYAEQIDEWWVFEIGADTVFNYTCAPYFGDCGDLVSHDGYDYSTVLIGEQCWFSENCRYLPEVSPYSLGSETTPYYYVYDYQGADEAEAKATANYETYGVLYNWPAVMTEGICPSGWHIPSDDEWQTMEITLGMSESEAAQIGWRGTDEGYQMKSTSGWNSGGNGSNSSGFTGLPGGYRSAGGFDHYGVGGNWWSASESGSFSWRRRPGFSIDNIYRNGSLRSYGFSARCVRD